MLKLVRSIVSVVARRFRSTRNEVETVPQDQFLRDAGTHALEL